MKSRNPAFLGFAICIFVFCFGFLTPIFACNFDFNDQATIVGFSLFCALSFLALTLFILLHIFIYVEINESYICKKTLFKKKLIYKKEIAYIIQFDLRSTYNMPGNLGIVTQVAVVDIAFYKDKAIKLTTKKVCNIIDDAKANGIIIKFYSGNKFNALKKKGYSVQRFTDLNSKSMPFQNIEV